MAFARANFQLVPFPIVRFGDIARLGFCLQVWCCTCKSFHFLDPAQPALAQRAFVGARFRCRRCGGGVGHPSVVPPVRIVPGSVTAYADLFCPRCVPPWEVREVQFDRPPWLALDLKAERYACPGCGRAVQWVWHGGAGVPFTASFTRLT